jgi:hypothetical protein
VSLPKRCWYYTRWRGQVVEVELGGPHPTTGAYHLEVDRRLGPGDASRLGSTERTDPDRQTFPSRPKAEKVLDDILANPGGAVVHTVL